MEFSGMPPIGSHSDTVDWLAAVVVLVELVVWASAFTSRQESSTVRPYMLPVVGRTCWWVHESLPVSI